MPLNLVAADKIPLGEPVPLDNLISVFRVVTQLEKLCIDNDGLGISAVQVGIPWNLFLACRENTFEYYLNCSYEGIGEKSRSVEGCLSLRNEDGSLRRFEVLRYNSVRIRGMRLAIDGKVTAEPVDKIESNLMSAVFQHEIDHALGILVSDIGIEIELADA